MIKKLFFTGGGGFVAGNIISQALRRDTKEWEIHAVDQYPLPLNFAGLKWHTFDLRDRKMLWKTFNTVKPDVVIHTAAVSDIDYCEANQDIALSVNVGVTAELAGLCREFEKKMILFSTDTVFDGIKGWYTENDEPGPVNFYGKTKVMAEKIVKETTTDWIIIRPSLVLGLPILDAGNSFLWKMVKALRENKEVSFPKEEIRTPIDVITLSRSILELAAGSFIGYLHLSGNDKLTRYDMAVGITGKLGCSLKLVVDKKPVISIGRAPRPKDVSLNNNKAKQTLSTPMLGLEEALDLIIAHRGDKEL
ncbi:MAG: NAD(P)-dependent oxidoreductase [Spirochaetota bacterium]